MGFSSPVNQRAKVIARGIAIAFTAFGLYFLSMILKWPFVWGFWDIVIGIAFGGLLFGLAYVCFKIAVDFWRGPTILGINSISALIGGLTGLYVISVFPDSWMQKLTGESFHSPWLEGFLLLGIIAAGVIYEKTKKYSIRYFQLSQAESAKATISQRKKYFAFVGFFTWSFLMQISMWIDEKYRIMRYSNTREVPDWLKVIFPFAALIVPIVLARIVYQICVKKFCIVPEEKKG
jgi:hypothetical protein